MKKEGGWIFNTWVMSNLRASFMKMGRPEMRV